MLAFKTSFSEQWETRRCPALMRLPTRLQQNVNDTDRLRIEFQDTRGQRRRQTEFGKESKQGMGTEEV
jgi:hypothetical protein